MNQVLTRDFVQHFKNYKHSTQPVFIKDRNQTVGVYISIEEWEKSKVDLKPRRLKREDVKKYKFSSGEADLSKRVDDIYNL